MSAGDEFDWIENVDGDRHECECCGCEVPLKYFQSLPRPARAAPSRDKRLCIVCSSTYFSHAVMYPETCPDTRLYRSLAALGNMILDAINPKRHEGCGTVIEEDDSDE